MKLDQSINEHKNNVLEEEVIASLRAFAELIFEAWREQRSNGVGKTAGPESLQVDGRSLLLRTPTDQDKNGLA